MFGYIIYTQKDFQKNRSFYEMLRKEFLRYGIRLNLMLYEQFQKEPQITEPLPRFVINRSRFHSVARLFESLGVRVFYTALVTAVTNDKLATYRHLQGVVPLMECIDGRDYVTGSFPYPIILKSRHGHGGTEVFMADSAEEEKAAVTALHGKKYLVQKCCSDLGRDVRVYILGNQIISAVLRTSETHFQSNYSLGGTVCLYPLNHYEKNLVSSVLNQFPLDYAGIDFTFHEGKAVFNEIEDVVGARMLYEVSDINISKLFAAYIVSALFSS